MSENPLPLTFCGKTYLMCPEWVDIWFPSQMTFGFPSQIDFRTQYPFLELLTFFFCHFFSAPPLFGEFFAKVVLHISRRFTVPPTPCTPTFWKIEKRFGKKTSTSNFDRTHPKEFIQKNSSGSINWSYREWWNTKVGVIVYKSPISGNMSQMTI